MSAPRVALALAAVVAAFGAAFAVGKATSDTGDGGEPKRAKGIDAPSASPRIPVPGVPAGLGVLRPQPGGGGGGAEAAPAPTGGSTAPSSPAPSTPAPSTPAPSTPAPSDGGTILEG